MRYTIQIEGGGFTRPHPTYTHTSMLSTWLMWQKPNESDLFFLTSGNEFNTLIFCYDKKMIPVLEALAETCHIWIPWYPPVFPWFRYFSRYPINTFNIFYLLCIWNHYGKSNENCKSWSLINHYTCKSKKIAWITHYVPCKLARNIHDTHSFSRKQVSFVGLNVHHMIPRAFIVMNIPNQAMLWCSY